MKTSWWSSTATCLESVQTRKLGQWSPHCVTMFWTSFYKNKWGSHGGVEPHIEVFVLFRTVADLLSLWIKLQLGKIDFLLWSVIKADDNTWEKIFKGQIHSKLKFLLMMWRGTDEATTPVGVFSDISSESMRERVRGEWWWEKNQ